MRRASTDETPEEAERAIISGLLYLEREARNAALEHLSGLINSAVCLYLKMMQGKSDDEEDQKNG